MPAGLYVRGGSVQGGRGTQPGPSGGHVRAHGRLVMGGGSGCGEGSSHPCN